MSTVETTTSTLPPAEDPYRYGWREDLVPRPDGTLECVYTPLALEDLVHPEENYVIVNGSRHEEERQHIWGVVRNRIGNDSTALALSDTGVYWDDPTLRHHCPDIVLLFGIKEPKEVWPSFDVAEEGVRPELIIELTSPHNRANDVTTKFAEYHKARVPWYIIVDRIQNEGPPTLIGYRWTPQCYVEYPADTDGRLLLEPLGLKLGGRENRVAVMTFDDRNR